MEETQNTENLALQSKQDMPSVCQLKSKSTDKQCPLRYEKKTNEGKEEVCVKKEEMREWSDIEKIMTDLFGMHNPDLAFYTFALGTMATPYGKSEENLDQRMNMVVQSLAESGVKDIIEARLVVQMQSLYTQGMSYLANAHMSTIPERSQFHLNAGMKLLRLHNETIEALNRYRRKGEQKLIVQHVNVSDGGQAVVSGQMIANKEQGN